MGLGLRVWGSGFRISSLGFRIKLAGSWDDVVGWCSLGRHRLVAPSTHEWSKSWVDRKGAFAPRIGHQMEKNMGKLMESERVYVLV